VVFKTDLNPVTKRITDKVNPNAFNAARHNAEWLAADIADKGVTLDTRLYILQKPQYKTAVKMHAIYENL